MPAEQTLAHLPAHKLEANSSHNALSDFATSFWNAAVVAPVDSLAQLCGAKIDTSNSQPTNNIEGKIGAGLGMAVDIFALSKIPGLRPLDGAMGDSLPLGDRLMTGMKEGAKLGAVYGTLLTPSSGGDGYLNMLKEHGLNAITDAATFGIMGAGAGALRGSAALNKFMPESRFASAIKDMGVMGAVGIPGGAFNVEANSILMQHKLAGWNAVKSAAVQYGAFGVALSGLTHGFEAVRASTASDSVGPSVAGRIDTSRNAPEVPVARVGALTERDQLAVSDLKGKQQALYNQFNPALERYHTGGHSNGGGVDGIQLPPKVSAEQLQPFIEKLSTFLAKEPGIDELEPANGQPDKDFRTQLEQMSAADVQAHSELYVTTALNMIQNPEIRAMVEDALSKAPPEWATAPSSSSGRYHPADEINQGGLRLHSLRAALMGAKLIDFYNQDASENIVGNQNLDGDQRDLIVGALLLHDIEKGGVPWNKYDAAHGPLGATYLESVWKDSPHQDFAREMEQLVNNHMAQWNKSPAELPDPKPPQDIPNQIVSYADYLGAQPDVFVQPFDGKDH